MFQEMQTKHFQIFFHAKWEHLAKAFFFTCLKQIRVSAGHTFWKLLCITIYQYCLSDYIKQ